MKYTKFIITTFLFFMGFLNVFPQRNVVSGGRTIKHKKHSPIKSTELKSLKLDSYISLRAYNGVFEGMYSFSVQPTENGECVLSLNNENVAVSNEILDTIQNIIKEYKLESDNGLYDVTAGLPPEFQPMHFSAEYKSGEKLSFTKNNNPDSEWTLLLFRLFRNVLIANGNTKYVVPLEQRCIDRIILEYSDGDGVVHMYGNIIVEDDSVNLYREVYEKKTNKVISEERVPIPANHYVGLNELVEKLEFPFVANYKYTNDHPDATKHSFCYIYANDAEGHNLFSSFYIDDEMTDEVKHILRRLTEYMDKPFNKKK